MSKDMESWENPIFDEGDDGAAVRRNPLFEDEWWVKEDKGGPSPTAGRPGAGTPAAGRPGKHPAVGGEGSTREALESFHEVFESFPVRQNTSVDRTGTDAFEAE